MSRGRMPGDTGNGDCNVGALGALACPRHRGDSGGRKLPPPTVSQVTFKVPVRRSMGTTWVPRSVQKGQRGRDDGWLRRKRGRTWSGRSEHTGDLWRR